MYQIVNEFLDLARGIDAEDTLLDAFGGTIEQLGYSMFCASVSRPSTRSFDDRVILARYPDGWIPYYLDQGYGQIDPLLRLCRWETVPFLWTDPRITRQFTGAERALMDEARDAKVGGGLMIPVRSAFSPLGLVTVFDGERDVDPCSVRRLYNLGVYFYGAARRLIEQPYGRTSDQPQVLTVREGDCLLWIACGKTDWEISAILGISESAVRNLIDGAKRKLGMPTRTQAVVHAVLSGQITP